MSQIITPLDNSQIGQPHLISIPFIGDYVRRRRVGILLRKRSYREWFKYLATYQYNNIFFGLLDVIEHSFALDSYKFLPIDFINVFITKEIVDGMEMVEFIMEIEDRFGVDIPDSCLSDLSTLGDLCKFIDNKLAVRL